MDATPTPENFDRVLAFLPFFESEQSHFYDLDTSGLSTDPYIYTPEVVRFISTLYTQGFIVPFDWAAWKDEAVRYEKDPYLLGCADLPTLRKLLTLYVRADRFNSGFIAAMIDRGLVVAILRRMEALRDAGVEGS